MYLNIIVFILAFLIIFFISLFCLLKKTLVIDNLYLIIPAICIGFWALYYLICVNFIHPHYWDYEVFYNSGKRVLTNPTKLYDDIFFLYMPNFAVLFAISFCLIPLFIGFFIFLILNYISAILSIREYNKILILMDVKQKIHRFMFLIIISNGYYVYIQFMWPQTKYFLLLIFLFIIRRELQIKKVEKEKNLNYYLLNYGLMVFAIGIAPYFIFLLLIYIFHNIPHNDLFKKENVKKYVTVVMMFIIQNFLFILYPSLLFEFLDGFNHPSRREKKIKMIYLRELVKVSASTMRFLIILFTIFLSIITIILLFNNKLQIEQKFGYFALSYLLIGVFSYANLLVILLFSFILLLFVPYLDQGAKGTEFIKSNRFLLIGLLSILGIFFLSHHFIIYEFFPRLTEEPFIIFEKLRWIFLLSIMISSLTILKYKFIQID